MTDQDLRRRVALLIPRLASDFDGEVVATVKAIGRALTGEKRDWHWLADLIREPGQARSTPSSKRAAPAKRTTPGTPPMSDWRSVVRRCQLFGVGCLSERDIDFIDTLARTKPKYLSPAQQEWLGDIAARLGMRGAA